MSDVNKSNSKVDLGLLEEDDEFEEFPAENWTGKIEEDENVKVWEDNWDDDNIEDDFSVQLRAELDHQGFLKDPEKTESEAAETKPNPTESAVKSNKTTSNK